VGQLDCLGPFTQLQKYCFKVRMHGKRISNFRERIREWDNINKIMKDEYLFTFFKALSKIYEIGRSGTSGQKLKTCHFRVSGRTNAMNFNISIFILIL
jgi:hypothetical protein